MRSVFTLTLALLVLALPAQDARTADSATMTIRLVSVGAQYRLLKDTAPKNQVSRGDTFWARTTLRNAVRQFGKPKGAVVGYDTSTFVVLTANSGDIKATAILPGGTIKTAGRTSGPVTTIRVTGGTGRYAGASGTVRLASLSADGTRASNVYRLQLP